MIALTELGFCGKDFKNPRNFRPDLAFSASLLSQKPFLMRFVSSQVNFGSRNQHVFNKFISPPLDYGCKLHIKLFPQNGWGIGVFGMFLGLVLWFLHDFPSSKNTVVLPQLICSWKIILRELSTWLCVFVEKSWHGVVWIFQSFFVEICRFSDATSSLLSLVLCRNPCEEEQLGSPFTFQLLDATWRRNSHKDTEG